MKANLGKRGDNKAPHKLFTLQIATSLNYGTTDTDDKSVFNDCIKGRTGYCVIAHVDLWICLIKNGTSCNQTQHLLSTITYMTEIKKGLDLFVNRSRFTYSYYGMITCWLKSEPIDETRTHLNYYYRCYKSTRPINMTTDLQTTTITTTNDNNTERHSVQTQN